MNLCCFLGIWRHLKYANFWTFYHRLLSPGHLFHIYDTLYDSISITFSLIVKPFITVVYGRYLDIYKDQCIDLAFLLIQSDPVILTRFVARINIVHACSLVIILMNQMRHMLQFLASNRSLQMHRCLVCARALVSLFNRFPMLLPELNGATFASRFTLSVLYIASSAGVPFGLV